MLKKYAPEDRGDAIDLFLGVFAQEPFNCGWLRREDANRYFADIENTPLSLSFLYYDDTGSLMGLCLGVVNDYFPVKLYEIKELAIRKDAQGQGRGKHMIDEIAQYLQHQNIDAIKLTTQQHLPAYDFYIRNGFVLSKTSVVLNKPIRKR